MILVIDMTEPFDIKDNHAAVADSGDFDGLSTPQPSECDTESEADTLAGDTEQLDDLESLDLDELVDAIDQAQILPTVVSGNGNIDEKAKDRPKTSSHQTLNSSQSSSISNSIGATIKSVNRERASSNKKVLNPSASNWQGRDESQSTMTQKITASDASRENFPISPWNYEKVNKLTSTGGGGFDSSANFQRSICGSCDHYSSTEVINSDDTSLWNQHQLDDPFMNLGHSDSSYESLFCRNMNDYLDEDYGLFYNSNRIYNTHYSSRMVGRDVPYAGKSRYNTASSERSVVSSEVSEDRLISSGSTQKASASSRDVPYAGESRLNTSRASSDRSVVSSEESEVSSSSSGSSQKASASSQKKRDTSSKHVVCNLECSACHRKFSSLEELEEHQNSDGEVTPHTYYLIDPTFVGGPCYWANPNNRHICLIQ